jgi:hypothetical protein
LEPTSYENVVGKGSRPPVSVFQIPVADLLLPFREREREISPLKGRKSKETILFCNWAHNITQLRTNQFLLPT